MWLWLMKNGFTYHLGESILEPRWCRTLEEIKGWSKTILNKVMVLCAVGQPRQGGGAYFDGLIGIYAFTANHIYQQNSKHHAEGDQVLVTKNVNAKVYREIVETRMIPDIKEKMSFTKGKDLFVQNDNYRVHIGSKSGRHKGVPNYVY